MTAATWLFVPGSRPNRFAKAAASGADRVICDLEDAVAPADKEQAREHVLDWLGSGGTAWVRVNAHGTPWYDDDVARLAGRPGLLGLVVPKAESPAVLAELGRERPGPEGLLALVETAAGVLAATDIASCPAVGRLAFGSLDLALDLDAAEDDESLLLARSTVVLASRAGGCAAPVDGVTTSFDDPGALAAAARRSRRLGFGGKLCIHPRQVAVVAAQFRPSEDDLAWPGGRWRRRTRTAPPWRSRGPWWTGPCSNAPGACSGTPGRRRSERPGAVADGGALRGARPRTRRGARRPARL